MCVAANPIYLKMVQFKREGRKFIAGGGAGGLLCSVKLLVLTRAERIEGVEVMAAKGTFFPFWEETTLQCFLISVMNEGRLSV